jgi:hypothetical protein
LVPVSARASAVERLVIRDPSSSFVTARVAVLIFIGTPFHQVVGCGVGWIAVLVVVVNVDLTPEPACWS